MNEAAAWARGSSSGRVDESRRQGCQLVQLTSDNTRTDAHRFYERLGFTASHVGFKLQPVRPRSEASCFT